MSRRTLPAAGVPCELSGCALLPGGVASEDDDSATALPDSQRLNGIADRLDEEVEKAGAASTALDAELFEHKARREKAARRIARLRAASAGAAAQLSSGLPPPSPHMDSYSRTKTSFQKCHITFLEKPIA